MTQRFEDKLANNHETISPSQVRAARALLGWSQTDLAERSGVARRTIESMEGGSPVVRAISRAAIREALEKGGIIFIGEGETEGVQKWDATEGGKKSDQ